MRALGPSEDLPARPRSPHKHAKGAQFVALFRPLSRITLRMLHALLALASCVLTWQPAPPARLPDKFGEVVARRFDAWDADHNGMLSEHEIDALSVDGTVKGPDAAAIATLKRFLRSGKYDLPDALTKDYLTHPPKPPKNAPKPSNADRDDSTETDHPAPAPAAEPKRFPDFQARFASCLRRIQSTKRGLALDDTPDLDTCRQGPLGSCFFVAPVGAAVQRDPRIISNLISEKPAGGYSVKFGDGRTVDLAPLTDVEVAISSTTGDEGLWLPVLEKAFGTLRKEADPDKYAMESATDAIANGGSVSSTIRALTGHKTESIALKRRPKALPARMTKDRRNITLEPDGKTPYEPALDRRLAAQRVRDRVAKALNEHRLVAASTAFEPQPPGISWKHAYAIIGHDPADDTLTLWNPHGNTFKPKDAKPSSAAKSGGLANGYATKGGVFTVPIGEFVRIFSTVTIEGTEPVPMPSTGRKASLP